MQNNYSSFLNKFREDLYNFVFDWIFPIFFTCVTITPLVMSIRHLIIKPYHEVWTNVSWSWIILTIISIIQTNYKLKKKAEKFLKISKDDLKKK